MHAILSCSFSLDTLGLVPNTTNLMSVYNQETHSTGSNFKLTTSILPINIPPIASDLTLSLFENTYLSFNFQGYKTDYSNIPFALILSAPLYGSINAPINVMIPFISNFTYTPKYMFNGNDTITYLLNDGISNSSVASILFIVHPVYFSPVVIPSFQNTTAGQTIVFQISATDIDTPSIQLYYSLSSSPQLGYVTMDSHNSGIITYTAINSGIDVFYWTVTDRVYTVNGSTVITIIPISIPPSSNQVKGLTQTEILISAVSVLCFVLLVLISAYFYYNKVAAQRFEKQVFYLRDEINSYSGKKNLKWHV